MYEKDQAVLAEVRDVNAEIKKDAGISGKNGCGPELLKEHLSDFSTKGLLYNEITADIMSETEDLFSLSGCCDRFSPQYLKICKTLTKAVDHLGGAYVTKAVLIDYDKPVTGLEPLTAERLNEMISFNFRKCKGALDEIKTTRKIFDLDYFNQMLVFANVMERLRATQYRVLGIHFGVVSDKNIVGKSESFSKTGSNRGFEARESTYPAFHSTPSYAPDYAVLKQELGEKVTAASDQKALNRSGEETQKALPIPAAEGKEAADSKTTDHTGDNSAKTSYNAAPVEPETVPAEDTPESKPEEAEADPFGDEGPVLGNLKHITEPSPYLDILLNGHMRAIQNRSDFDPNHDPGFIFTEDEIEVLLNDPAFLECKPEMAEQLRRQMNSG
ncbi:MAG: hypothetical protein II969_11965 [Anaerolineaceae bacterium]|nr:hypothetical protein [Anaerolineaceae bacterium]